MIFVWTAIAVVMVAMVVVEIAVNTEKVEVNHDNRYTTDDWI